MSNIKKFRVEHTPTYGEIIVEIDFDFVKKIKNETGEEDYPITKGIEDMVNFWSGSEGRLEENEGNYLTTFLKQLCNEVIGLLSYKNLSTFGVIEEMKGEEGWCPLDGTFGIKLINVSSSDLKTQDDYEITELS